MTSSIQMLKLAHQMRDAGEIPDQTAFWAVENPLTNAADRVRQKVGECVEQTKSMRRHAQHAAAYHLCGQFGEV